MAKCKMQNGMTIRVWTRAHPCMDSISLLLKRFCNFNTQTRISILNLFKH